MIHDVQCPWCHMSFSKCEGKRQECVHCQRVCWVYPDEAEPAIVWWGRISPREVPKDA